MKTPRSMQVIRSHIARPTEVFRIQTCRYWTINFSSTTPSHASYPTWLDIPSNGDRLNTIEIPTTPNWTKKSLRGFVQVLDAIFDSPSFTTRWGNFLFIPIHNPFILHLAHVQQITCFVMPEALFTGDGMHRAFVPPHSHLTAREGYPKWPQKKATLQYSFFDPTRSWPQIDARHPYMSHSSNA